MSLEAGTFVSDLVATNPPGTDKKNQGDDHLRLIKSVLQASFPNSSKAFYVPSSSSKTVDFTVVATDMNRVFIIDTTAGIVTATLPTLVVGDAGWECTFIKTNTGTSPYFIAPASGTIQSGEVSGLSKTRRCIPGHRTRVLWTGVGWIAERIPRLPIGAIIDVPLAGLPVGYEWANGQALSSAANYPDYNSVNGSLNVPDRKGRAAFGRDDMGGAAANRITNAGSGIVGTTLGASGGLQNSTLLQSDLPNINQSATVSDTGHSHTGKVTTSGIGTSGSSTNSVPFGASTLTGVQTLAIDNSTVSADPLAPTAGSVSASLSIKVRLNGNVTQTAFGNMPPAIITNMLVVVE